MEKPLHNPNENTILQLREENEALKRRLAEERVKQELISSVHYPPSGDDIKLLHELQLHKLEMEMQNDELRSSHFIQEEFDSKYSDLFEFAPYGYIILNLVGDIQKINLTGTLMLGIKRNGLFKERFENFIHKDSTKKFQDSWSNLIKTRTRQVCEVKIFQQNGQRLFLKIALSIAKFEKTFQILLAATDITIEKQIEDTQSFLLGYSWSKAGNNFFEELSEYLYKTLGVDYVCIDKLIEDGMEAETVAVYFDGKFEDNVRYKLKDTPCGKVSGKEVCCFSSNVRQLFPKDKVLQEMLAESYVGITLFSAEGKPIGIIAVIGRKPILDIKFSELVLKQVSIRAASELEHRQAEEKLQKEKEERKAIIDSAMDGFWINDLTGSFLEVNEAYCKMSGYTEEELLKMKIIDVEYIETQEKIEIRTNKVIEFGEDRFESQHRRKNGSTFFVEVCIQYRKIGNGQFVVFLHDITNRKKNDAIILQAKEDWERTFDAIPDMIAIIDKNHKIVRANKAMATRLEINKEQCIGAICYELMHHTKCSPKFCPHSKLLKNGKSHEIEIFEPHLNANLQVTTSILKNANGEIIGSVHVARDISERKKAENALKESEERFSKAFRYSPVGINIFRLSDGNAVNVNDAFLSLTGYTKEEVLSHSAEDLNLFVNPEVRSDWMMKLSEGNQIQNLEVDIRKKSGEIANVLFSLTKIEMNKETMVLIQTNDITERKKSEALRNRYNIITQFARDPMILVDNDGCIIEANNAAVGFYGYSYEELVHLSIYDIRDPKEKQLTTTQIQLAKSKGFLFETIHKHKNGTFSPVEVSSRGVTVDGKEVLLSVIRDISERRKADEVLRQSEERYRSIFLRSLSIMMLIDPDTAKILDVNQAACNFYGWKYEEFCKKEITSIHLLAKEEAISNMQKAKNEKENHFYFKHRLSNDEIRDVEVYSCPLEFNGKIVLFAIIHDITERKILEEALRESEYFFRESQQAAFIGSYKTDFINNSWESSEVLDQIFGIDKTYQRTIEGWSDIIYLNDQKMMKNYLDEEVINNRNSFNKEYRIIRKNDGEIRWVHGLGKIEFDENTKVISMVGTIQDITKRKQYEENLLKSEEKFRLLINDMPVGVLLQDAKAEILLSNQHALEYLGLSEEQLLGKTSFDTDWNVIHEDGSEFPGNTHPVVMAIDTGLPVIDVVMGVFRPKSNDRIWLLVNAFPQFNGNKTLKQVVCTFIDITKLKKTENELMKSEDHLKSLYSTMNEGLANHTVVYENEKAIDYIITDINPAFEKITGFDRNFSIGKVATELYGIGKPPYLDIYAKVAEGGKPEYFETYFPPMDKYFSISVFSPAEGSFATLFNDITERKKKDEKLIKLNQTLIALSKSSQAMVHSNNEMEYLKQVCDIVINDCGYKMVWIGYAEDDAEKTIRPIASAGFEDDYLERIKLSWGDNEFGQGPSGTAIRTGKISRCRNILTDTNFAPWREYALKRGYASSIVFPLFNGNEVFGTFAIYFSEPEAFNEDEVKLLTELSNDLAYGIVSLRLQKAHQKAEEELNRSHENLENLIKIRTRELEITNKQLNNEIIIRLQHEQHLINAEEKYRTVADYNYDWETWLGLDGRFIYISPSCKKITGYTADEFMDNPELFIKIVHEDDREMIEKHFLDTMKDNLHDCSSDFRIITRNGKERWIGHNCQPVYNADGVFIGQRGSNRDITKRKHTETVLIESQKHLRALTQRMDAISEEERTRIAREIHDELGHLLTALKYDVETLINNNDNSIDWVKSELSEMVCMIEALIDSVRKIATELRPGILDHLGLFPAIEWKIEQFKTKNKISCQYTINEMDIDFDKNETTIIYRILQEIFTNVSRHSKASNLRIVISYTNYIFEMSVSDNGIGFNACESQIDNSLGLLGMRERALSIGGKIKIESAPGEGTKVIFTLKKI